MPGIPKPYYGWNYGFYNDRECFPVFGPGIEPTDDMSFATPKRAEQVAKLFQRVYAQGISDGKAEIRAAISPRADFTGRDREWGGWIFDAERQTFRHDADGCGVRCCICGTPWATESPVVRVDSGPPRRMERLRAVGNVGAPPVVAASAFLYLARSLGIGA